MSLLIKDGLIVADPLRGECVQGSLLLHGDRVAAVGRDAPANRADVLDAAGCWVLPGLVDAHTHLYGALATGMPLKADPPQNFPQILERIWWRLDKALQPEDVRYSGYIGGIASLLSGITTIFDHHASPSCPAGSLSILAEVVQTLGLRASLAYEVSDRDGPASRDAGIAENRDFFLRCQRANDPMLKAHFGIHAVFSVSDATMRRCAEVGRSIGAGFHLHVLEHRPELEKFSAEHAGLGVVEFLENVGILGARTIAAHTVHVGPADAERFARTGTHTVHNPRSNMGNGVGVSPVPLLLRAGVSACLGSDGFYDMPLQMALAPALQNLSQGNPSAMGGGDALKMVYGNNAALAEQTFGLPFGRLTPGCAADVLVIPYDPATPAHAGNLGAHILAALAGGPRDVIVGGVLRVRGRRVLAVEAAQINARARELAGALWQRL
jgi:putative selenium metabolism protein SsnA